MKKTAVFCIFALLLGFFMGQFYTVLPNDKTDMVATAIPEGQGVLSAEDIPVSANALNSFSVYNLDKNTSVLEAACDAVEYIKARDYKSLSDMIHPVDGVIFAPYSTINLSANLRFTAKEIASLEDNDKKYIWGITDGKGAPIQLTMRDYFSSFVFNADYTAAPMIGVNTILQYGNSLENVEDVFPEADYVEFHFPGLKDENEGLDWCSLKLVFVTYNSQPKIVAVIHSQWTI